MYIVINLLGGIGLFIYGMTMMGASLEKTVGNKMKKILEAFTSNTYIGILVGMFVAAIIQSSTATTVMVVGFVNAGIMNLLQAAGVIMGANIGTTITAQIVAFDLGWIAPAIVGISVIIWMLIKNRRHKNITEIFIGFGLLFIGMFLMKQALLPLKEMASYNSLVSAFNGTLLSYLEAIFIGFIVTAMVQSSSAVIGIIIAMASQGLLTIELAMPLVLGANVGTCLSAIISSIGANKIAKRAAAIHLIFNIISVTFFVLFLRGSAVYLMEYLAPHSVARQIANAHTFFNIVSVIFMLPFTSVLVWVSEKIFPKRYDESKKKDVNLDIRMLETPSIALAQIHDELIDMMQKSVDNYNLSVRALLDKDEKAVRRVTYQEEAINFKQKEIEHYLVHLAQKNISAEQHERINLTIAISNDIERISDIAENISELAEYRIENDLLFSEKAVEELKLLHGKVYQSCLQIIDALKTNDVSLVNSVLTREININGIEKDLREGHINRLNKGECAPGTGIIFLDTISNMERIADHVKKVGYFVIEISKF